MTKQKSKQGCPCGGVSFAQCCEPFVVGKQHPTQVEALMRSRYTAYTLANVVYLLQTWADETKPSLPLINPETPLKWIDLRVLNHTQETDNGIVEFIARYKLNGKMHQIHEISRFVHRNERWYYLDGTFPE